MQLGDTMTKRRRYRFERFKIIFPILLAGWIPSILTLIVSYTILRDTLESRILRDRQTLIQLVGHLVAHDLNRSSSVIEYYQTLPEVVNNLSAPNPQVTQQWLNSAFYSHPQIDGMFITTPNGDLIASIPTGSEMIGKDFGSEYWREQAATQMQPLSRQFTPGCRINGPSLALSVPCVRRARPFLVMSE